MFLKLKVKQAKQIFPLNKPLKFLKKTYNFVKVNQASNYQAQHKKASLHQNLFRISLQVPKINFESKR